MFFNSYVFITFLAVLLPTFYLAPKKAKIPVLLVFSYIFYGYWDWRFCLLLLGSTVVDFYIGAALHKQDDEKKRKRLLLASLVVNLGVLGFFKYYNFFIDSFNSAFGMFGGELDFLHLNIILPVGISFYTFQTLSYTIDIYRKQIEPTKSIMNFALFVAFFPQLVAGPIEKAKHLLPQLENLKKPTKLQLWEGFSLLTTGFFKKVLIGDAAGKIVDNIFAEPAYYRSPELLAGLVLFSVQIYADFSGYSSIARGIAKFLGVDLMINFEQPYLSSNITEFWRRWHISLSSWLKEYLYFALGGNRRGKTRTYINLMITMLLGGLWHGANWTFVVWGAIHGICLAIHKISLGDKSPTTSFKYENMVQFLTYLMKVIGTYTIVLFAWLFFRAENLDSALTILGSILDWTSGDFSYRFFKICAVFLGTTLLIDICEYYFKDQTFLLKMDRAKMLGLSTAAWVVILCYMLAGKPMAFVYFQF